MKIQFPIFPQCYYVSFDHMTFDVTQNLCILLSLGKEIFYISKRKLKFCKQLILIINVSMIPHVWWTCDTLWGGIHQQWHRPSGCNARTPLLYTSFTLYLPDAYFVYNEFWGFGNQWSWFGRFKFWQCCFHFVLYVLPNLYLSSDFTLISITKKTFVYASLSYVRYMFIQFGLLDLIYCRTNL